MSLESLVLKHLFITARLLGTLWVIGVRIFPGSFGVERRARVPQSSERGAALVAFTILFAFVLVPMLGLGIDTAIQYWIKAKLSAAVDSAALSAARSLNVGNTIASQTANAQLVGRQFFAANFPPGVMGTTVFGGAQVANSVSITVTAVSSYITVNATAQVSAPLYFMKLLHFSSGTITASSQTTRRNANIVLLLDRSGSMNNSSNSCAALVSSVESFANQFVDGRDQIGMITFSTSAYVDYAPTIYFKTGSSSLNSTINNLVCVGATSTAQGLYMAYNEIENAINQPGALNVILFFTDGQANAVVAQYPVKQQTDTRYGAVSTSQLGSVGPSTCPGSILPLGGFTDFSQSANMTGQTGGVYGVSPAPLINQGSNYPAAISVAGCGFSASNGCFGTYNVPCGRNDVAYIPAHDFNGYPTTGYKPSVTFTSGPYINQIRSDSPLAIRYAAMNAADAVAQAIHSNATYGTVVYSIGLTGNEAIPMDTDFMERIANDPRASNYNANQPQGLFVLATDNATLADAFNAIASQILRLSK
jgi:Mg-chelatase subunit ChlD